MGSRCVVCPIVLILQSLDSDRTGRASCGDDSNSNDGALGVLVPSDRPGNNLGSQRIWKRFLNRPIGGGPFGQLKVKMMIDDLQNKHGEVP